MENKIPYQVIKRITNNYDKDRILGSGAFGTVYKAIDENGETIAVKVLDLPRFDDAEFCKEFDNLKRLKHENIVELVGFCNDTEVVVYTNDNGEQIPAGKLHTALCLEYVQNGHLGDYISDESKGLHWHTRYKIIKGVCEGLKYLREGINPPILHLDLKPQNILLDKDMIPKVADFGLSRLFGEEKTTKTASTCGTIGYVPPEYTDFQVISDKFDIYSLGVIMVKIITGRDHFFRIGDVSRRKYINQVHDNWRKRLRQNMTSGSLEVYCQQVRKCIELALDCMKKNRRERPTIQEIVSNLIETETIIGNLGLIIEQIPDGELSLPKMDIPENPSPENDPEAIRRETGDSKPTATSAPEPLKELSYDYLAKITREFKHEIGREKFYTVYEGILEDGQVISVIRFDPDSPIGRDRTFTDRAQSLCAFNHKNIVKILGYCREERREFVEIRGRRHMVADTIETLLCHEYLATGSFAKFLNGSRSTGESGPLDWDMRFKMIVGICQGLHYLHNELHTLIIHTELTPANILLDHKMEPKILDSGQSRLFNVEVQTRDNKMWSERYGAPEYLKNGELSAQTDIYSLGMIILKIMERAAYHHTMVDEKDSAPRQSLINEYITSTYKSVDARRSDQIKICIEIGLECVYFDGRKRPSISEIVEKLNVLSKEDKVVLSELLELHPKELCFPFEPKIPIYCSLQLRNKGEDHVAFMVVPETPKRYLTKLPLCGIVPPTCTYTHTITMRKQKQQPCGEYFKLHRVAVGKFDLQDLDKGSIIEEYGNFFNKAKEGNGDHEVQEVTLMVNCDPPVQEPSRSIIEIINTKNAQQVASIDVHPIEPWIMTTHKGGSLHVLNYKTMETLVSFEEIIEEPVHVAKFVDRENWLVAGDANGSIHVYSYDEHEEIELLDAHYSCIVSLAVHPTRPFLLSSSQDEDNLIKLWDWDKNWQCTRTFPGHADKVMQVIFNSNIMGIFISASLDGTVKIWSIDNDSDDGDIITLDGKDRGLLCADNFERYNVQHLIAGCIDGTAQIWNTEIKGCVGKLERHAERISAVNLHPELPMLITGSFDGTVRLWNSDTYKLENIIDFNLGQVNAFGFIKELRRIVVGCQQGMAMVEIPMRL